MAMGPGLTRGWARASDLARREVSLAWVCSGRTRYWTFGLLLLAAYLGNQRASIGAYDTYPNEVLPYALVRGYGPFLERFENGIRLPDHALPDFATTGRGHILSRYPVAPALLTAPLIAPQIWYRDLVEPGWDSNLYWLQKACSQMSKNAMAILAALAGALLLQLLDRMGLGRAAVPAALAGALGSDLWAVASQAAWQHGPAVLMLVVMLRLLTPGPASRAHLAGAGLAAGMLTAIRLFDVVFPAAVALGLLLTRPRDLAWFIFPAVPIAAVLLAYNLYYFGVWAGGQDGLEALHASVHGVEGIWTGRFLEGAAGTLFSPARGLFVFSPWAAPAVLLLPATARRVAAFPAVAWTTLALVPYAVLLSKYSVWWGGHSFGPRYWIEASVPLAILLAFAIDWSLSRRLALRIFLVVAIAWSIALQAVGAWYYPSSWNQRPHDVDRHHERLWDWRDTEISRCLIESRFFLY
ncbi:hypothetical protein [Paludisphaera rhizosphaerae]|uniref:hypothetical protein n=1 Tax=Paludisphaera rhizosphaerae TaxID=2711216 RepID=UPI0013EB23E8|nr:hypothetical protein [Paludisphaera rhizosphaerae]